jgi:hypothetical protein
MAISSAPHALEHAAELFDLGVLDLDDLVGQVEQFLPIGASFDEFDHLDGALVMRDHALDELDVGIVVLALLGGWVVGRLLIGGRVDRRIVVVPAGGEHEAEHSSHGGGTESGSGSTHGGTPSGRVTGEASGLRPGCSLVYSRRDEYGVLRDDLARALQQLPAPFRTDGRAHRCRGTQLRGDRGRPGLAEPMGTVRSRGHRARKALRIALQTREVAA